MKLLLDQNISYRLLKKISDVFPDSGQVLQLGLNNAPDMEIWSFAKENDFVIVTFDSDFFDISVLNGYPPKIVWIRTHNQTTKNIEVLIKKNAPLIKDFIDREDIACLEIS